MATIELTTSRVNLMSDKYLTLKGYISAFKTSNETMKTSTFLFDDCICNAETIRNNIQITVDKQETELTSIDGLIEETDEFFDLVLSKDEEVANEIENRKDDFYEEYDYLKPDCEKSSWENFWEGTAEWCAEHWDIITVVLVVLAVIVLTVVAVVTFGAGAVALVALVGAIVGVASQLAGDILNFIATGDWESSFVDYVGAALGGAVGGIVTLLSGGNAYLAGVTDSAVSSLFSNSVENITGIESHTFGEMMLDTTLSVGLSLACTFCFDKLTTKMLAQMEIKNNLKNISKRLIEVHLYDLMLGIGMPDYWVESKKQVSHMDLKEYNACFKNGLKRNKKPFEGDYYVPIHIKLPFTIPIAFQGAIALFNDLEGNPINEIHNLNPKYIIESVYLTVLPLKDKSVIIMFIKNGVKRYSRFFKQMKKLTEAEQLSVLNYIVFAYCEDYFISPDISKDSLEKLIQVAGQTTEGLLTSDHQPNLDEVFNKGWRKELENVWNAYINRNVINEN